MKGVWSSGWSRDTNMTQSYRTFEPTVAQGTRGFDMVMSAALPAIFISWPVSIRMHAQVCRHTH